MITKVLIVGLGSIGKRHLRLARELLPSADIRILRHRATGETPEYANGCFFSIDEVLAFAPQVAVIANPAPFHIRIGQALADAGVHLLIEKPLSDSLEGVSQLVSTCERQGSVLLIGYNLRYLPSLQRFRELLNQRVIGSILSVRCETGQHLPDWRPDSDYRHSVSANRKLGGGVLLELSHELDYLRWIFGEISWVKATLTRQSNLEIDVEDSAHLTLGFKRSNGHPECLVGALSLDLFRHDYTRLCTAIGETGSIRWNGITGEVDLYMRNAGGWRQTFVYPHHRDDSYRSEWQNFISCVLQSGVPLVSGEDGQRTLAVIEAARKSAELSGQSIDIVSVGSE